MNARYTISALPQLHNIDGIVERSCQAPPFSSTFSPHQPSAAVRLSRRAVWPFWAAADSGVADQSMPRNSVEGVFGLAPAFSSAATISALPFRAASYSGVSEPSMPRPSVKGVFGLAPAFSSSATPHAHVDVAPHMRVLEKLDDSRVVTGVGSGVDRACFLQCFNARIIDAENRQGKQREEEASEPPEQASSHRPQVRPSVQNAKGGRGLAPVGTLQHQICLVRPLLSEAIFWVLWAPYLAERRPVPWRPRRRSCSC